MREVPRRRARLAVALPGTLTLDTPHLREKTNRVGLVARTIAMFRVDEAIIYRDQKNDMALEESKLFEKILRFQETPQYLRRHLFGIDPDLKYAGILPPLRSPHHPDREEPRQGQLRDGVVVSSGINSRVEAGFTSQVEVKNRLEKSTRLTIRITRTSPSLEGERVETSGLHIYWGFEVARSTLTLGEILKKGDHDLAISTSVGGTDIRRVVDSLREKWAKSERIMLAFGSPREGIPEILHREGVNVSEFDFDLNTIPSQGVETVRTEEALLATLGVLNLLEAA